MDKLRTIVASPITYVIGFAASGALSIAVGIGVEIGAGWGLAVLGAFLLAASAYITKGMTKNG